MTAIALQHSLFRSQQGVASLPQFLEETQDVPCPESFRLVDRRQVVERTIIRRDCRVVTSRVSLAASPRKRALSEEDLAALFDREYLRSRVWPKVSEGWPAVRLVDLFSSCGIMSLGVWEACRAIERRLQPVLALDTNAAALKVYEQNFAGTRATMGGVESLLDGRLGDRTTDVERRFVRGLGNIDILVGGPPCQGHSNLNNHTRRADPKNALYERMARFAEIVRPTNLIIENVSAVLHDRGQVVSRTAENLVRLGYSVDQIVADVSTLGAAQRRRRHILVASLTNAPNLRQTLARYERPARSVKWAIGDLRKTFGKEPFDTAGSPNKINQARIDFLFKRNKFELPDSMRPDCHRLKEHSYKSAYGRMHWDEPSQTITSGFSSMGQGRYVHAKERRTLTPHEAARLQFIPDFFQFDYAIGRTALAEMIANAVPTKLTYVLALELLR